MIAKRKRDTKRFTQPITIENSPEMIKRIATNLKKLLKNEEVTQ